MTELTPPDLDYDASNLNPIISPISKDRFSAKKPPKATEHISNPEQMCSVVLLVIHNTSSAQSLYVSYEN